MKLQQGKFAESFLLGLFLTLVAMGLPMIGISVNVVLGGIIMLLAFIALAYSLWTWEGIAHWGVAIRVSTVWTLGIFYFGLTAWQLHRQYIKDHPQQVAAHEAQKAAPPQVTPVTVLPKTEAQSPKSHSELKSPRLTISPSTASSQTVTNNAPNGIAISGGQVDHPTVNNMEGKRIKPDLMKEIVDLLNVAKVKKHVTLEADQVSGASPFPDDFNKALKASGWTSPANEVSLEMQVGCCGGFRGAIISAYEKDVVSCNEGLAQENTVPECFIFAAFKKANVSTENLISPNNENKDTIRVVFVNGFPN